MVLPVNRMAARIFCLLFITGLFSENIEAQKRIFRYPDVSDSHIVFSFADDLWLVPIEGGQAVRLSSPTGQEMFPRFSPDGKYIAFSAEYDGNTDIYKMKMEGGIPERLTYHDMAERVVEWYPSGDSILFASMQYSGKQRYSQFFRVAADPVAPAMAQKLPLDQAEFGSFSPDGKKIAFTYKTRLFRTWKRYAGGMAADIFIYDLQTGESENITNSMHNDELPMWHGDRIYYLSDRGEENRYNIWVYDPKAKTHTQITDFEDRDVHFPSLGPKHLVFEAGGELYLLSLADHEYHAVSVTLVDDFRDTRPRMVKVRKYLQNVTPSPDGKRVLAEARGEIFDLPGEKGIVKNLTGSSGSAQRYPSWSPDGSKAAWWSDESGEYQLYVYNFKTGKTERKTDFKTGYGYQIFWSPDSKKVAFARQDMRIYWLDLASEKKYEIDQGKFMFEGALDGFEVSWASDSRYLTYAREMSNRHDAVFIYDTDERERHQVTSGFYNAGSPSFSGDGKFIVLETDQRFSPQYSSFESSWVYVNSTQLALLPLSKKTASPFLAENDTVAVKKVEKEEKKEEKKDEKESEKKNDGKKEGSSGADSVRIDFDGIESRMVIVPVAPGNIGDPALVGGKVFFMRYPARDVPGATSELRYYDLSEKEEKTVLSGISFYEFAADGKSVLTGTRGKMGFVKPVPGQKIEESIPLEEMQMNLNPKEEWKQIFEDAWRIERDFFYDPGMHGVDWAGMKSHYGALVDNAWSRTDLNYILGELIGELNASHTYRSGGDMESSAPVPVGYLGIDWTVKDGAYMIDKIIRPAPWDTEVRSPLDVPGIDAEEGDFILTVNGMKLNSFADPYAAFEGLGGKTVELEIAEDAQGRNIRRVWVETLTSETRLRNMAWIEANRKYVEEASGGKIGYVYVPSTGLDGQMELVRMFYGQVDKEGLIVDERFNNGGQIPDRFIELLDRPELAYWDVRDGETWSWPPAAHFGPKAMLINGWSGSGGDAFPDYFRKTNLGPLIGTTTWGGLIGISGAPTLVDGGSVTAPTFRMYNPDRTWFAEGHGVEPDIEVPEDPSALARGEDPQLKAAVDYILQELKENPVRRPLPPKVEKR